MSRLFFNQRANIWDSYHSEQDNYKLEQMLDRLEINPGERVLDVGSGTGIFLPYLLRRIGPGGELVALDYAEEMLKVSHRKYPDENIRHLQADIASLPLDEGLFDIVICYSCFPHFPDKVEALREMYRVTGEHGRLFICHTSSRDYINEMHRSIAAVEDAHFPDEDTMRELLSGAGYTSIRIEDGTDSYLASARKESA